MKTALIIAGPLLLCVLGIAALINSNALSFSEATGMTDAELEPIEYREGNEVAHTRRIDGVKKFGSITLKWPLAMKDFDFAFWRFVTDGVDARVERLESESGTVPAGVEMRQIDPPQLVIPAGAPNKP